MNPTEYAWSMVQAITQKHHNDIKLLVDEIDYPKLEQDSHGFVLRLSGPIRHSENLLKLQGMYFDNDQRGRLSLWRLYKASVSHLCAHAILTDYSIYKELVDRTSLNNLMFSISMVEDYVLRGYMSARWPGLMFDTAYANHVSALRMKDVSKDPIFANKMAANLLSYMLIGRVFNQLGTEVDKEVESIHTLLLRLEATVRSASANFTDSSREPMQKTKIVEPKQKTAIVERMARLFEKNNAQLSDIYTPPYTDSHGENELFGNLITVENIGGIDSMTWALKALSIQIPDAKMAQYEKSTSAEADTILGEWEFSLKSRERLVEMLRGLDPNTHFEHIVFPREDYSEFVRTRSKLIGPIKRVLDQLRMVKSTTDESQGKESGFIDTQAAIQVVASKSKRNDVFMQDEIDKKSESWAIVGDLSKSLETIQGEMRDVLVSLSEVAKELFPSSDSWACYAFNEDLHVIKDFSEAYNSTAKGRIGGLPSGLKTYLPDAIRIAGRRLAASPGDAKVLLVASDGFPLGYDGIEEDLIDTIEQVTKSGIILVGLGIGSEMTKQYFKTNCSITQPYDLMKYFVKTYMEISSLF
ncbi:MAG: hypothetical protein M1587_01985 [Thaumarchaeota archaeon]|nr:hypothetical protein [Nitrososphaerota archaeon]